ncbi:MAG: GntR family transcriptional regulator [Syntrophobacteraceae bacterium]
MKTIRPLDRTSPLPLYSQIKERLIEFIREQRVEREREEPARLPAEDILTEAYGVSRMTVRQAVQELVNEGLLYRKRGVGTFIAPPQVTGQLTEIERFTDEWQMQGKKIKVKTASFHMQIVPSKWAKSLGLPPEKPLICIERHRWADDLPVALDFRYLPPELSEFVSPATVEEESIFLTLVRKGQFTIEKADYEISARKASRHEASFFGISPGHPVLSRELIIYASPDRPVITGVSIYRAELFKYSISVPSRSSG